jgi:hypothetical protein
MKRCSGQEETERRNTWQAALKYEYVFPQGNYESGREKSEGDGGEKN